MLPCPSCLTPCAALCCLRCHVRRPRHSAATFNSAVKMRRMGLEHDVQGASDTRYVDYASKQLADDSKPVGSGSGAPTGRGAHSSRMGHGERSFFRSAGMKSVRGALAGPSAGTDVDGRLKRRGSAAAMEDLSSDKRAEKAKRLRVLKTFLHDAEAKLMGRMVDAFTFSMRNGVPVQPFELPLKPILQYAGETIKCPYSERHFKRYLTNASAFPLCACVVACVVVVAPAWCLTSDTLFSRVMAQFQGVATC